MITIKALSLNVFVLALANCPHLSLADGFTSADVLEWAEDSQDSFFQTSVTMIGVVATQTGAHGHIAACIDDWYWEGNTANPEHNDTIRAAMQRFPDLYPQAIVLAVVEKQCGKFSGS
ncbi:hypothetical protein [Yoonia sp. SS1-5]|uniref:Rap1a immunity protein domain-containing protein n=1 Tax=Yoonia rhodophyticola TaxID=3137370 RepID=A0AAN0MAW3_9RHOB